MVFIVPPNGEKFALDVNPNTTTLHQLKVAIEEINGMPVSNQRLFLSLSLGQNDSDLMSNLEIQPFSTLTLHGADDTTSSTVKEELVNEADSEPESESDDEEAKAREEAYEYDKIEKKLPNQNFFEFRRKRLAAEIEDKCFSAMAKIAKEKLLTHMNEQEYEKILEEEEKKAMDDELKEVEEDRKQAEKKAKEAETDSESESDDEAKAREEAYEYFIDSDSDVDDKIEKKLPNHNFFEFRRKRLAAEIEDKCFSAMAKIAEEKLLAHMNEQEYEKILEEEEKKAMDDELKEVEEDRKQAEKKAKKEAKKKAKKARKELDMKAEEAKEG